ncbi:MAG TPA: site-specific DNA-methyltransferase [Bellilinea sp.]|nr:site-specific DNA-methyltransferase [Bellilinea sp.]
MSSYYSVEQGRVDISNSYSLGAPVTLYRGDRLELLRQVTAAGAKAELIVTSPPYNIGKAYENVTSPEEYIEGQRATIEACLEVLSPTGSICWQVGHYIEGSGKNKEAFPLDLVLYPVFKSFGLKLRNRIVWHFGHGLHDRVRFSGRHETILWFTWDTDDYTFNLDPVRVPQKYPGKRAYSGPKKGKPSGNPRGKNPSDVWDMPNVKSNHVEKTDHPCQFPVALIERLVLSMTNEGDLVIDPYMGVGTTAVAALLHKRAVAGADTEQVYIDIAKGRVGQVFDGTLNIRPLNKPIYEPSEKISVARLPEEWENAGQGLGKY